MHSGLLRATCRVRTAQEDGNWRIVALDDSFRWLACLESKDGCR